MVHTHVQNFWWCTYLPSFLLWDLLIEHIHSTIPIELLHIALLYRINAAADYQCCQLQTTSFKMYESQFSKTRKKRKIKNSIFPVFDQLSKVGNTAILSECGTKLLLFYKFFFGCHPIAVSSIDTVFLAAKCTFDQISFFWNNWAHFQLVV